MDLRVVIVALALLVLSGCSAYSQGNGSGGKADINGRPNISCDATPPNQPGCYAKPSKYGSYN